MQKCDEIVMPRYLAGCVSTHKSGQAWLQNHTATVYLLYKMATTTTVDRMTSSPHVYYLVLVAYIREDVLYVLSTNPGFYGLSF